MNELLKAVLKRRRYVTYGFYTSYLLLFFLVLIYSIQAFGSNANLYPKVAERGLLLANSAVFVYALTLIPGILKRFGLVNPVYSMLITFRRELGILMYLLAVSHGWLNNLIWRIKLSNFSIPQALELAGITAVVILFALFVTSNNYSQKKLGPYWKKLHRLTYLALGVIFIHVALVKKGLWIAVTLVLITAEIASFIYYFASKKKS